MKRKAKRLSFVGLAGLLVAAAVALILNAFEESIVFFRTPSDIASGMVDDGQRIRLGGLVEDNSIAHGDNGLVRFAITDTAHQINVEYVGILPDLFREGQGVVTEGLLKGNRFVADEVLAKHDENYMPPEVAAALKEAGQWKGSDE